MKFFQKGKKKLILLTVLLIFGAIQVLFSAEKSPVVPDKDLTPTIKPTVEIYDLYPNDEEGIQKEDTVLGSGTNIAHPERISARVVGVRDGDTIEVDFGGENIKTVRYIGIDTPETVDPRKSIQCFGTEASNINKSLVENQIVQLEKDVSETDKYGRLLRYVFLGDIFLNKYLVEEGFAHASSYPPDIKYQEDLDSAEEEARLANKGLWGACASASSFSPNLSRTDSVGDRDCSDFGSHQEAQEYFIAKGGSSTNNVDKLDGSDHDGLVCETL